MTAEEKLQLDVRDFWRISDGLESYVKLDPKETMERLREHKEDGFCWVTDFYGSGRLLCTRDAYDAISDLAERHRDSLPVPDDYSVEELAEGIRRHIVRAMVEEKADEPALARVLAAAVEGTNANHVPRTYHFPCILVGADKPPQFQVGPVVFTTARAFPEFMAEAFRRYTEGSKDPKYATERLEKFGKHISSLGWVASVPVPACGEEPAKRRAETAVTTTINLLRLFLGVPHARDMRLAHSPQGRPVHSEYAIELDGKLNLTMIRRAPGALVDDDWHLVMDRFQSFWARGAHLVSMTLQGRRSEIANRVIDALGWFGEAAFEPAAGTQIVKFVAALERLTTTQRFKTHVFCARVALLAHDTDAEFDRCYWDAHTVYNARSKAVHGGLSPNSAEFLNHVRLAHDITRDALFRGLEVHCLLDDKGQPSTLQDLNNFFEREQSKRATALSRLREELRQRRMKPVLGS